MEGRLHQIAGRFAPEGRIRGISPLGSGLINDTFRVRTDGPDDFVLQRINQRVFRDVDLLQRNIDCVTRHIRGKLEAAGEPDIDRKVLRFLPDKETGRSYWTDGREWWRMSVFIRDSRTVDAVTPDSARCAGLAFGRFEAMLADLPDALGETIPDFHNMELRIRQLHAAVASDAVCRMAEAEVRIQAEEILALEDEMCLAERLYRAGVLPKRICHCDSKVNNILFDRAGNILCVIDLDTVMPSFVFSDFGDFLRSAANPGAEDDPEHADFDMEIFTAFARGYLSAAGGFLTPAERENLPFAATLFPFMQSVRFLTDYINGDTYYKVKYPRHNWDRTRAQWKLFRAAREKLPAMSAVIGACG